MVRKVKNGLEPSDIAGPLEVSIRRKTKISAKHQVTIIDMVGH